MAKGHHTQCSGESVWEAHRWVRNPVTVCGSSCELAGGEPHLEAGALASRAIPRLNRAAVGLCDGLRDKQAEAQVLGAFAMVTHGHERGEQSIFVYWNALAFVLNRQECIGPIALQRD